MADVFISYHVSDNALVLVRRISKELEDMGISCWYAPRDTNPGAFVQSILEAINHCTVFLMVLDKDANGPGYVFNEMVYAFNLYKKERHPIIIPFKIGDFQTDPDLGFYLIPFHIFNGGDSFKNAETGELISKIVGTFGNVHAKIILYGSCGDAVTYTLDENGVLAISGNRKMWDYAWNDNMKTDNAPWLDKNEAISLLGTGKMWDYAWDDKTGYNMPWWDKREKVSLVSIKNGITYIGKWAFDGCINLKSVSIPESVTRIGDGAFRRCTDLPRIIIPHSVTTIGLGAFERCTSLYSIAIPDSIVSIELGTFYSCTSLTSVNLPKSVTNIGATAFAGCRNLANINIPNSVICIDDWAFDGCTNLTSVSVPTNVKINKHAFPEGTKVMRRPLRRK